MRRILSILVTLFLATYSSAHYHILIPEKTTYQKDDTVILNFKFGHPFECELQDALKPEKVIIINPKGQSIDITSRFNLAKEKIADKEILYFKGDFKMEQRGDYIVIAKSQPVWMTTEKKYIQDTIKVVVHVQTQNNWDAEPRTEFELMPLSRPYGILPGMVARFQINEQARKKLGPPNGWMFEIEKWNPVPPKNLPPDELITFTTKAEDAGVVTFSAPESGWWGITTEGKETEIMKNNTTIIIKQRSTFWYFVNPLPNP